MRPTQKHRPAIWENMLGTVYARNDAGEIKYFDYRWDDARVFAGVEVERDPRVAKATGNYPGEGPRRGQAVLWVLRK